MDRVAAFRECANGWFPERGWMKEKRRTVITFYGELDPAWTGPREWDVYERGE
jgi:hypothetical protein